MPPYKFCASAPRNLSAIAAYVLCISFFLFLRLHFIKKNEYLIVKESSDCGKIFEVERAVFGASEAIAVGAGVSRAYPKTRVITEKIPQARIYMAHAYGER